MPTAIPPTDTLLPIYTSPAPTATATPTVSPTASITLTPTVFTPFHAVTTAAEVRLRTGPGYQFPVLRQLAEGSAVMVLGKAPGDEWIHVQTSEKIEGWVFHFLLSSTPDLEAVPLIEPSGAQLVRGRVRDAAGTPIRGVSFNIFQGTDVNVDVNTVLSDGDGEFYSYMPLTAAGTWTVGYSGIACDSNVWTDATCTYYLNEYTGTVDPASQTVVLPFTGELEFTWK